MLTSKTILAIKKVFFFFAAANLAFFYVFAGVTQTAQAEESSLPKITEISISKDQVKAGDELTVQARVEDEDGVKAVSADFSYNGDYTNRPSPTFTKMNKVDGSQYSTADYTVPSDWQEGDMYITVAAKDNNGNYNPNREAAKTIIVDNTPPEIEWQKPKTDSRHNKVVELEATSVDELTQSEYVNFWWWEKGDSQNKDFEYVYRGDEGQVDDTYPYSLNTEGLEDGQYFLRAATKDAAGNYASSRIEIEIDNTGPTGVEIVKYKEIEGVSKVEDGKIYIDENEVGQLSLTGKAAGDDLAKLQWQAESDLKNNKLLDLGTDADVKPDRDEEIESNEFLYTKPGSYSIVLTAFDDLGNKSEVLDKDAIVVENVMPDSPSLSMSRDDGVITLKWNKVIDENKGYQILKNGEPLQKRNALIPNEKSSDFSNVKWSKDSIEFTDYNISNDSSYEYRVRAYDEDQDYLEENLVPLGERFSSSNSQAVYVPEPEVEVVTTTTTQPTVQAQPYQQEEGEVKAEDEDKEEEKEKEKDKIDKGEIEGEDIQEEAEEAAGQPKTNWPMIVAIIIAATIVLGGAAYWWYGISEDEDQI